jgi:acetyl-CoA decarbonylase/synthase complex subunit gamma
MDIYKLLPGLNCKECGEDTCMAFASALIERTREVMDCPPFEKDEYKEKGRKLLELMTPPVKEIVLGTGERAVKIGGEEVMYRHELTFFNQTALAFDVDDAMTPEELEEKVRYISKYTITRVGQDLRYDAIAIRSKTGDATKFGDAVMTVCENTDMPIILCSLDPDVLEVGAGIAAERKPLLYAATKDNWERVVSIALDNGCPVVASAPGDIQALADLVALLEDNGVEDIVLDPGTEPTGEKFGETIDQLTMLRMLAIEDGVKTLGYPILGIPAVAWMVEEDPIKAGFLEASIAAAQIMRFCSVIILHSPEVWSVLPNLTLRQNIFTDPRKPIKVDPGLYTIGKPDESSPVMMTTNFALTYYTVEGDLMAGKVDGYVLVVDTEGLAVEPAMAGAKLNASVVKEVMESSKVAEKVNHKKLIIPAMASRISGEIEDETGWEVMVGPIDSSRIPGYLEKEWPPAESS